MNITKFLLIGAVALTGALFTANSAEARDRDHRDHHGRHEYRTHHHRNFDRPYAYQSRRGIIHREAYFARPRSSTDVTIAVGGHRHHR